VNFHYALVDDLLTKDEFERRVEAKIDECGDLIDEPTAAMLVVGELGRAHVTIKGLSGKSSLFSFFAKVLDKTDLRVFDRSDGEKGAVATLLVGDGTGTARVVLWDEQAAAAGEICIGDVLEIIGRHPGKNPKEIYALALRRSGCLIECTVPRDGAAGSLNAGPVDLEVIVLAVEKPRTFIRKDGTGGTMTEAVIGDEHGTARLIAWAPELLSGVAPGLSVRIIQAKPDWRGEGRSYSLDEKGTVVAISRQICVPFTPLGAVGEQGHYSVQGTIRQVNSPRAFTLKTGAPSWVRNIVITDGKDDINVVIWGEKALVPLQSGDHIEVYHAPAKTGRSGGIELGAGRGSAIYLPHPPSSEITFEGTVISSRGSTFIDNGHERYLLEGDNLPPAGDLRVTGKISGSVIRADRWDTIILSADDIRKRAQNLKNILKP
jgi:replication factor A1